MAEKKYRISLHPWIWWMVVRRAVENHTQTQDLGLSSRRKASEFLKAFAAAFPADDAELVRFPYETISSRDRARAEARNKEILAADPDFGVYQQEERDPRTGQITKHAYRTLPNPALRSTLDLLPGLRTYVIEALEAYAKRPDVPNVDAPALCDAEDALKSASEVEIPAP